MGRHKKDPLLDVETLRKAFGNKKINITEEDYKLIKASAEDYEFDGYTLVDSLLDNKDIIIKFRINFTQYLQAIKFCAYLVGGKEPAYSAYAKAFADREFVQERINDSIGSEGYKQLASAASRYANYPYVKEIIRLEANSIYLSYRKEFGDAVDVLATEMKTAAYSKDRIAAADKLLTHIKPPETLKIEANINHNSIGLHEQIQNQLEALMVNQQRMLDNGIDLKEVQRIGVNFDVIDMVVDDEQ